MPSNKFNRRPVPKRRPPICQPPPVPPYPPVPPVAPRHLSGFVRWTDLDPALDYKPNVHGYIHLDKIPEASAYKGQTPPNRFHVVARVELETPPDLYLVELQLHELGVQIESHSWPHVKVFFPFETRLLTDVVIPGQDYRLARFLE